VSPTVPWFFMYPVCCFFWCLGENSWYFSKRSASWLLGGLRVCERLHKTFSSVLPLKVFCIAVKPHVCLPLGLPDTCSAPFPIVPSTEFNF
jgi:hypothetical protein